MDNSTPSQENQALFAIIQPYINKYYRDKWYLGLFFEQGKRQMIQINVPAEDLPTLLQAKPSTGNDPDSGKNRPEVKGHSEEIKNYILERVNRNKPWIVGTLTANVDPNTITVIEFGLGFCFVVIPRGVKLDITDGQHRKKAIHELIESSEGEKIGGNSFPITLVLEGEKRQCQSDFRDMAQTRQLDKSLLLSFGEFEGRVGITKNLIENVGIFQDKTEKIKATPATKLKLIYTTNYIAKLVSCIFKNDVNHELKNIDVKEASEASIDALNQFFEECEQTKYIHKTPVEYLSVDEVNEFKEQCILAQSVGLEILGRLFYCTYDKEQDEDYFDFEQEKISALAQLDWSRKGKLWQNNIVVYKNDTKNGSTPYKIVMNATPIRIAISQVKAELGWG